MIAASIIVALLQFGVVFLTMCYIHLLKKSIALRDELLDLKGKSISLLMEAAEYDRSTIDLQTKIIQSLDPVFLEDK